MKHIAIIGYGVVGGGITEVLEANRAAMRKSVGDDVQVKYILDLREFPDSPYADRVVHTLDPIVGDPDVALVCETMGGAHPALEYSLACLRAGKSVVTSNKQVVANFGDVLLKEAKEHGVFYFFEASVAGGIPLIRPFLTSLACDTVSKISGIVNGTTNFILTKMREEKRDFDDVLREAQLLGYAERDPSADVDGIDAKRKIIILAALASGILAEEADVTAETLRTITPRDLEGAAKCGGRVKLIAEMKTAGDLMAYVCPMIVPASDPLASIEDVYNGISVTSPVTGDILYYGRGAGRYPTAGAVLADVAAILSGAAGAEAIPVFRKQPGSTVPFDEIPFTYYVRAAAGVTALTDALSACCDRISVIDAADGTVELTAGQASWKEISSVLRQFDVQSVIRMKE